MLASVLMFGAFVTVFLVAICAGGDDEGKKGKGKGKDKGKDKPVEQKKQEDSGSGDVDRLAEISEDHRFLVIKASNKDKEGDAEDPNSESSLTPSTDSS